MATIGDASGGLNGDWEDIVVALPAASGVVVIIQNKDTSGETYVVFGGTKPTTTTAGSLLREREVIWGSGTSIWVRSSGGYRVNVLAKE